MKTLAYFLVAVEMVILPSFLFLVLMTGCDDQKPPPPKDKFEEKTTYGRYADFTHVTTTTWKRYCGTGTPERNDVKVIVIPQRAGAFWVESWSDGNVTSRFSVTESQVVEQPRDYKGQSPPLVYSVNFWAVRDFCVWYSDGKIIEKTVVHLDE